MQNGYHTAKVEWIKDEPIPPEELGNMLFSLISVSLATTRYLLAQLSTVIIIIIIILDFQL